MVESPVFAPDETRSHLDPTAAGMKRRIDATHTIGSKKFWLSVHDNFPGHRIESLNLNNGKSFDISKAQIHHNQDKLWGDDSHAANIRFRIHPKD